jgi:hypothetical protein
MRPGAQDGGGHDGADAKFLEKIGAPCPHDGEDPTLVSPFFACELEDAPSKCPENLDGDGDLHVGITAEAQPGSPFDHLRARQVSQSCSKSFRCRHDEALQLPLGIGASVNGGATSCQQNGERDSLTDGTSFAKLTTR